MKNWLMVVVSVFGLLLAGNSIANQTVHLDAVVEGAEFSADTVLMDYGPPLMLPAGKTWKVLKRVEFKAFAINFPLLRFTLVNTSESDPIQIVSIATTRKSWSLGHIGYSPNSCIDMPGSLRNVLNVTSNLNACITVKPAPELQTLLPSLLKTTINSASVGMLAGLLQPLGDSPSLLQRLGANPVIATGAMYRDATNKQTNYYSIILKNSTAYLPKTDPTYDQNLRAWAKSFFIAALSQMNEDPERKSVSVVVPNLNDYSPTQAPEKTRSSDSLEVLEKNVGSIYIPTPLAKFPAYNRVLVMDKERDYWWSFTSGWIFSEMVVGSSISGLIRKHGPLDVVLINDAVYDNFRYRLAD